MTDTAPTRGEAGVNLCFDMVSIGQSGNTPSIQKSVESNRRESNVCKKTHKSSSAELFEPNLRSNHVFERNKGL